MLADDRNFRSTYYEKVGCRSVEERKSLEILLKDKPLNRIKLKQFCLSYSVPAVHRCLLWNLLLGVAPVYSDSHEYVLNQRLAVYNDLLHALQVLRVVDETTAKSKIFYAMYLLENKNLKSGFNVNTDSNFYQITEVLTVLSDSEVEIYWISKGFYKFALDISNDFQQLQKLTFNLLEKKENALFKHLEKKNILYNLPLDKWYATCFAGIITKPALIRVWDKICGGARKIVVFVCLVIFNSLSRKLIIQNDVDSVVQQIDTIKENFEIGDHIVNTAISLWQQNSELTEFVIHRKDQ